MRVHGALQRPVDSKHPEYGTFREHYEAMERATGVRDPLLDAVRPPAGFEYLWDLYWQVYRGATEGMSGIRLSWRDLADFQSVTGISLASEEVDAIMEMDSALRLGLSKGVDDGEC